MPRGLRVARTPASPPPDPAMTSPSLPGGSRSGLTPLAALAEMLAPPFDREAVPARIAQAARRAIGADRVVVVRYSPEAGSQHVCLVKAGVSDRFAARMEAAGAELLACELGRGEAVFYGAVTEAEPLVAIHGPEGLVREGFASSALLPIAAPAGWKGRIDLYFDRPRSFEADAREVARLFARQATLLLGAFEASGAGARAGDSDGAGGASAEEARRTVRQATLGRLVGKLLHELRNPLGIACGSAEVLKNSDRLAGEDAELLGIVDTELQHLRRLVQVFQEYASPRPVDAQPLDFRGLANDLLRDAVKEAPAGVAIRVSLDVAPESLHVEGDLFQLKRLFASLLLNAVQAMPSGGELSVTARPSPPQGAGETGVVDIVVADTGVGMPQSVVDRCLEPFAVARSGGLGLGLPLARRIAEDHRGSLRVESRPGAGTRVTVRLPGGP
ncbi:MAG: hypothetical protein HYZ53_03890 [Planctomycetes bacterium]|nr:hypothetical protein [Planctomycetota bacterium]